MYGKIIFYSVIALFLAIFQMSFISGLPNYYNEINIVILISVFVLGFSNLRFCLYWSFGLGLIMDIYSFLMFGTYLFIFPVVILSTNFLFVNFFTNRSLYALVVLSMFSSVMFKVLLFASCYFNYFLGLKEYFLHINLEKELKIIVIEFVLAVILFYFFDYINKNSRATFLSKYKL